MPAHDVVKRMVSAVAASESCAPCRPSRTNYDRTASSQQPTDPVAAMRLKAFRTPFGVAERLSVRHLCPEAPRKPSRLLDWPAVQGTAPTHRRHVRGPSLKVTMMIPPRRYFHRGQSTMHTNAAPTWQLRNGSRESTVSGMSGTVEHAGLPHREAHIPPSIPQSTIAGVRGSHAPKTRQRSA